MKPFFRFNAFLLTAVFLASYASIAAAAPVKATDGVLTDSAGMTLYTYDRDAAGKSACNERCASNWPPLLAQEGDTAAGDYSIITRDDGKKQWAYKSKPLYRWNKDSKPGDKKGDGFLGFWHAAKP
jgi:predicted lipoprotein with Yx(FWY)xxD motif